MNVSSIGKLLSDCGLKVMVVDSNDSIVWSDVTLKNIYGKDLIKKDFSSILKVKAKDIKKPFIFRTVTDNKYCVISRKISIEKSEYHIAFFKEITDLTDKEIRLYCLEEIINRIDDGVMISNYEGRIMLYNKAQESMEELSSSNVVGKYLWEAYNYNPEMSEHKQVYKTKKSILNYRAHAYKNGVPKYVSYSTHPILIDGEPIAVYSISKNETKLRSLLFETLELKRRLFSKDKKEEDDQTNKNGTQYSFTDIIGESVQMKTAIREAQTVSLLDTPILIIGETGSGKEVFAQSIHNFGKRDDEPFVAINCAAIPENLLESILFGTVKGSYTGAIDQSGLFEQAGSGTIFLDELNSMPISMQVKLLRVLQEKQVRRVGNPKMLPVHCRIISAMSEEPKKLIQEGRLRQDLFFRVAGYCLYIPPLRERKEDIMITARYYVEHYNSIFNKRIKDLSIELVDLMQDYSWPGNVRELIHFIENLMIRASNNQYKLTINEIPLYIIDAIREDISVKKAKELEQSLPLILRNIEKKIISESLKRNKWNKSKTAEELGIIRQSLDYRINKLGIDNPN